MVKNSLGVVLLLMDHSMLLRQMNLLNKTSFMQKVIQITMAGKGDIAKRGFTFLHLMDALFGHVLWCLAVGMMV